MFLREPTKELRQGDVCADRIFPRWNLQDYEVGHNANGKPTRMFIHVLSNGDPLPTVVCSHDCDIENPRTRMGILIAPLLPWPSLSDEDEERLEASRARTADETYDYINWFPLTIPTKDGSDKRIVDFSAILSTGKASKVTKALLAEKLLEMTDEARAEFKSKLAAFLGRP